MEALIQQLMPLLLNNLDTVLTVLAGIIGAKAVALGLILASLGKTIKRRKAVKADGLLTVEEKAELFDLYEELRLNVWKVLSGITPFKTWF